MSRYLELVAVIVLPTALGYSVVALVRGFRWADGLRNRHRTAVPEPIDRLAEIYRVEAELRQRGLDVREPVGH